MSSCSSLSYPSSYENLPSSYGSSSNSYLSSQDVSVYGNSSNTSSNNSSNSTSQGDTSSSGTGSGYSQADTVLYENSDNSDPSEDLSTLKEISAWGILYTINDKLYKTVHLENDEPFVLGRYKGCQYQLMMEDGFDEGEKLLGLFLNCSKKHFKIFKEENPLDSLGFSVRLQDLSTNGTFVDGILVGKGLKCTLSNTSRISLVNRQNEAFIFVNVKEMLAEHQALPKIFKERYCLEKVRLGAGAAAVVRLGRVRSSDKFVAVKIIEKKVSSNLKDFGYEAEMMLCLNHNNIVKIYDVFDCDLSLHLVIEYVAGGSLFNHLQENIRIDENIAKPRFQELIDATAFLHSHKVTHRDLKAENILLTSKDINSCIFKITDFGLSRFVASQSVMRTKCGTPAYVAPEVLSSGDAGYSKKVDVWSLGCVLFFMLCGRLAFDGKDVEVIKSGDYEYPTDLRISDAAKELINSLLTVDPEDRIPLGEVTCTRWFLSNYSAHGGTGKRKFLLSPPQK